MDHAEQQKITERIKLLLNLTAAHGCMPGEVEVAAYKIGSLVQKYGLVVSFPEAKAEPQETAYDRQQKEWEEQARRARAEQAQRDEEWRQRTKARPSLNFEYGEVTVIGETEKALFLHDDENETEFWIPRSQCRDGCQRWTRGNSGVLFVSQWWAEKEGWV